MIEKEYITQQLQKGMIQGEMHSCLRDNGRLAGGFLTGGAIDHNDARELESIAVSLSSNKELGLKTWRDGFKYGVGQPLKKYEHVSSSDEGKCYDWDDTINTDDYAVIDKNWIPETGIPKIPGNYNAKNDIITYLSNIYEPNEYVSYVTESFFSDKAERHLPTRGSYDRTAGKLLDLLKKTEDITDVFGNWTESAGAWIRHNPVDGKGIYNDNVTNFRHVLVESDKQSLEKQYGIYQELKLPITVLIHSGKKSLHAIVKVDADSHEEYKKRVDFLYTVCKKNGLDIDSQNRNASRLSRMPGISRNGNMQYIISQNVGLSSWDEWVEYVEEVNDDLPDIENLADMFDVDEEDDPMVVDDIVAVGEKMILSGASKSGKSFLLLQLSVAVAEGEKWIGHQCNKGKILYINLELKAKSCRKRLKEIYKFKKISPKNINNIHLWHLRGKAQPLDKLTPKIIRRAKENNYSMIILDPCYKIITGDENSARDMGYFCNQFDKLCNELNAAIVYAHHHSKGSKADQKNIDRGSGSGVFGRDPDVICDMIELEPKQDEIDTIYERMNWNVEENISCWEFSSRQRDRITPPVKKLIFKFPYHVEDSTETLANVTPASSITTREKFQKNSKEIANHAEKRYINAYDMVHSWKPLEQVNVLKIAEYLSVSDTAVYKYIKKRNDLFKLEGGHVFKISTSP